MEMHVLVERISRMLGFIASHELRCIDMLQQFMEAFYEGTPEQQAISQYGEKTWSRRVKEIRSDFRAPGETVEGREPGMVIADSGMKFIKSIYVCPDCGDELWIAVYCQQMFEANPELDEGGLMVCVNHPLLRKQLYREEKPVCYYELALPKQKNCGGCGKKKE